MKCKYCQREMKGLGVNDNPDRNIAYNVYQCVACLVVARENVWAHKAVVWIKPDNQVETT
jgi:hypothetical protein